MKSRFPRSSFLFAGLATLLVLAGCSRKSVSSSPGAPTAPPAQSAPTQPGARGADPGAAGTPGAASANATDLAPVFFGYDSVTLDEAARTVLDRNAALLREHAEWRITIEGHCDERGTVEYNFALGERRAKVARDYLADAGVAAARMQIVSYGKERPFDDGHDEAAWSQNRRAHLELR